jgi:hypothetical protein
MRIIFHNPHETNLYKTPISFFLEKRISVQKYTHLIDYFIERKDKIYFFIDSYNLDSKSGIKKIFPNIGFYIWLVLNKINPFRVKVITNHLELRKEDILFFFHINNFTNQQGNLSKKRLDNKFTTPSETCDLTTWQSSFDIAYITRLTKVCCNIR